MYFKRSKKVTFVEQDKNAANILKENIIQLSYRVKQNINNKVENFLKNKKEKFNIFFLDPPFLIKNLFKS